MRANLTKKTIFTLYKCKESFKNSNQEMYEEFLKMFDEDLEILKNKEKYSGDWNYLLLILFFKYGKLTAKDVFKIVFPNEISTKLNGNYNTISNRLTALFKDKICYRISHLSEENRQYYEYHLNYENKDFDTSKITDKIYEFIKSKDIFSYEELEEHIYPKDVDVLTPENIKRRLKIQLFGTCKSRNVELLFYPTKKNALPRVYYTNKKIGAKELEKYFKKCYPL